MPDWENAPVWWQSTTTKGHWPAFPAETQLRLLAFTPNSTTAYNKEEPFIHLL